MSVDAVDGGVACGALLTEVSLLGSGNQSLGRGVFCPTVTPDGVQDTVEAPSCPICGVRKMAASRVGLRLREIGDGYEKACLDR